MRHWLLVIGATVMLGGVVAGTVLVWASAAKRPASDRRLPPATARVTRTTLVETKTVTGTLRYGDPTPIRAIGPGMLTWIAPVGSTVKRGEPLFKVDERPVVELYGSVPLYRTLRVGAVGADVRQLQENLSQLGYQGFTVDGTYTAADAAAVRKWQTDIGLPPIGTVDVGQAVFVPGAVRIAVQIARLGDLIDQRGAQVLGYTSTTSLVSVQLNVADQALAVKGRKVTVTVPGRKAMEWEISDVGTVITAQKDAGQTGQKDARIEVTVTIADQEALGPLNAAPVDVAFVSDEREDVLTVPVAALLALAKGGYGVEIVDGNATRIVAVRTGLFAAGRVEISGDGINEGTTVGVPN